jgi:hypothetical protein
VKDRQGPIGRAASLVGGIAATARRRQRDRDPRVVVYDAAGRARAHGPGSPAYEPLLETGSELIELGRPG